MARPPLPPPLPTNLRNVLALNIIRLRREKEWSQATLAIECELDRTFIAHVERGARNISLDNIERIAIALGVDPYLLLIKPDGGGTSAGDKTSPAGA